MGVRVHATAGLGADFAAWCRELPRHVAGAGADQVIHRARNALVRLQSPAGPVVVKAFGRTLGGVLGDPWRGSKAERSFRVATGLEARGVPTPRPLAWCERLAGPLVLASWYVSAAVDDAVQLKVFLSLPETADWRAPLLAVGRAIAGVHRAGVHHRDLSPGNLITARDPRDPAGWMLVDLNRARFQAVPDAVSGARLLDRLVGVSPDRSLALLAGYAAAWGADLAPVHAAWRASRRHWERRNRLRIRSRPWRRRLRRMLKA